MAIITEQQFKDYTGNQNTNSLNEVYINSASEMIENYLGYAVEASDYTVSIDGSGEYFLGLGHKQINSITSISINDSVKDITNIVIDAPFIYSKEYCFSEGDYNIDLVYNAGFTVIPNLMVLTALRIATLIKKEDNGDVGLKGKSFEDGSRDFYELSFDKYLKELDPYRV